LLLLWQEILGGINENIFRPGGTIIRLKDSQMDDQDKSKQQLIEEVEYLRKRVVYLERTGQIISSPDQNGNTGVAEISLSNHLDFVQDIIDAFPSFALVIDDDHNIILANQHAVDASGHDKQELIGRFCPNAIHDLDGSFEGCPFEEAKLTGQSVEREISDPVYGKWINSAIYPLAYITHNGKKTYLHVAHDISVRKENERKIKYQIEYLHKVIDSLTQPFYIIDAKDYTIKLANAASNAGALTDKAKCYEVTHKSTHPCKSPNHSCPVDIIKKTGNPVVLEHEHYLEDGSKKFFEVHGYPIFDDEGAIVEIIEYTIDITPRKQFEFDIIKIQEALRKKTNDLEERNVALKVLLDNLEEEKENVNKNILRNINNLIIPFLEKLQIYSSSTPQKTLIDIIHLNLSEITKPLSKMLMDENVSLSPVEFQVANLIREGKSAKEIAELMLISVNTVKVHYKNIRKKLEIRNKKINLRSYLQSILT